MLARNATSAARHAEDPTYADSGEPDDTDDYEYADEPDEAPQRGGGLTHHPGTSANLFWTTLTGGRGACPTLM